MAVDRCCSTALLTDLPSDISLSYVKDLSITLRSKQQGYKYFNEGYFTRVKLIRGDGSCIQVAAKCFRSQRKNEKPHAINMDILPGKVDMANCSCTAGASGCCSHIIGLIYDLQHWLLMGFTDVPSELSCTSLPQQWSIPRGSKIVPDAAPSILIVKPKMDRKRAPVQNKLMECRKIRVKDADLQHLKSLCLPISSLISTPSTKITTHLGVVGIGSGLSTHASFYEEKNTVVPVDTTCGNLRFPYDIDICLPADVSVPQDLVITGQDAIDIEVSTRGQVESERWHKERKLRLTASKFHSIIKRKTWTETFVNGLLNGSSINTAATTYGRSSEKKARQEYVKRAGHHVHDCGFIVNPKFPFIGATPDGKVCDGDQCGILEIKCPYSARDMGILDATNLPNFCLDKDLTLKSHHQYYCQVQGQLLVSGAPFCDFVVYTKTDFHVERIVPNLKYMEDLLLKLSEVYFQHVHKYVASI